MMMPDYLVLLCFDGSSDDAPDETLAALEQFERRKTLLAETTGFDEEDFSRLRVRTRLVLTRAGDEDSGMRLDLVVIFDNGSRWVYEIKSLAFCPSNYGSRWKNKAKAWGAGASPADAKAATTATGRAAKASGIDERLGFRGKDGVVPTMCQSAPEGI